MPIVLYRCRLGWVLGRRFLLLTHTGRKSGLQRNTVLEVAGYRCSTDSYFVVSGWGNKAQWFRNVAKNPKVEITVGIHSQTAIARPLTANVSEPLFRDYGQRHPKAMRHLARLMIGHEYTGSAEDFRILTERAPMVELLRTEGRGHKARS